jgi:hypothetical protein
LASSSPVWFRQGDLLSFCLRFSLYPDCFFFFTKNIVISVFFFGVCVFFSCTLLTLRLELVSYRTLVCKFFDPDIMKLTAPALLSLSWCVRLADVDIWHTYIFFKLSPLFLIFRSHSCIYGCLYCFCKKLRIFLIFSLPYSIVCVSWRSLGFSFLCTWPWVCLMNLAENDFVCLYYLFFCQSCAWFAVVVCNFCASSLRT